MSNIEEKIARYKLRIARRMMRAQARSFFRLERRMEGSGRNRRPGKDARVIRSLRAELALLRTQVPRQGQPRLHRAGAADQDQRSRRIR